MAGYSRTEHITQLEQTELKNDKRSLVEAKRQLEITRDDLIDKQRKLAALIDAKSILLDEETARAAAEAHAEDRNTKAIERLHAE